MRPPMQKGRHFSTVANLEWLAIERAATRLTSDRVDGALARVGVLDKLVLLLGLHPIDGLCLRASIICQQNILLPLDGVIWPPPSGLLVLEHARREALRGRRQFAAAELGHCCGGARADDEDLLLPPFCLRRHRGASRVEGQRLKTRGCPPFEVQSSRRACAGVSRPRRATCKLAGNFSGLGAWGQTAPNPRLTATHAPPAGRNHACPGHSVASIYLSHGLCTHLSVCVVIRGEREKLYNVRFFSQLVLYSYTAGPPIMKGLPRLKGTSDWRWRARLQVGQQHSAHTVGPLPHGDNMCNVVII